MSWQPGRYHNSLHEIPAWKRREIARNEGRKCEKRDYPKGYRAEKRAQAKAATRRDTREQIMEAVS